jgi:malonate-semialdehyde dehydrogenase (acetylating)/methylmalonate-semialdehyde dehydrogenase
MISSRVSTVLAPGLGRRAFSYAGGKVPPTTQNVVGGQWVESKTDRWIDVHNPATNEVVTRYKER